MENVQPHLQTKGKVKFIIVTILGLIMFMVQIPSLDQTLFLFCIETVQKISSGIIVEILLLFLWLNAILSFLGTVLKYPPILNYAPFQKSFCCSKAKLVVNLIAPIIIMVYLFFKDSPLATLSNDVITMCTSVFVFLIVAKVLLPMISDYGLAEFLEELLNPLMRPIFKLPGTAIMAIVTSSFVSVTIAILLIADQFFKGYYNRRETVLLITCLTLPAMPVSILLTSLIGIEHLWGRFYLGVTLVAILMSALLVRIPPILAIPATYHTHKMAPKEKHTSNNKFVSALHYAGNRALEPHASPLQNIAYVLMNMTSFIPFIVVYGTLSMFLINETPLVYWLTKPYAFYLGLFHLKDALIVAPALFLNTIDVILSPVIMKQVGNEFTRFAVLMMFLGQMTYLAPFLLTLSIDSLINVKTFAKIALIRIILIVPISVLVASLLYKL